MGFESHCFSKQFQTFRSVEKFPKKLQQIKGIVLEDNNNEENDDEGDLS